MDVCWSNVSAKLDDQQILRGVWGRAKPGEMLAIMGPSGGGKTTLLNCISGRTSMKVSGELYANGIPINKQIRRRFSYVLQEDLFFNNVTLRQHLWFYASVRLPQSMTDDERNEQIDKLIKAFDLEKCQHTKFGDNEARGLSGGEKKRLNIACELIVNPPVILLDEPTSGLDAATSIDLIKMLVNFSTKCHKTIIISIHQPSSQMFFAFNKLLLVVDGHVGYYGKTKLIVGYFNDIGYPCPVNYNPADHLLQKVKESETVKNLMIENGKEMKYDVVELDELKRQTTKRMKKFQRKKPENFLNGEELYHEESETSLVSSGDVQFSFNRNGDGDKSFKVIGDDPYSMEQVQQIADEDHVEKWPTNFFPQFKMLTWRSLIQYRKELLDKYAIGQTVALLIMTSIIWFRMKFNEERFEDRNSFIFFFTNYYSFVPVFEILMPFPSEKTIINRERSGGYYRLSAYYLSKIASNTPIQLLLPTFYLFITYWTTNLMPETSAFFLSYLTFVIGIIHVQSYGICLAIYFNNLKLSALFATIFILTSMVLAGFYVQQFPQWLEWAKYVSFMFYLYSTQLYSQYAMSNHQFECLDLNETSWSTCQSNNLNRTVKANIIFENNITLNPLHPSISLLIIMIGTVVMFSFGYFILRKLRKPKFD